VYKKCTVLQTEWLRMYYTEKLCHITMTIKRCKNGPEKDVSAVYYNDN